MLLSSVVVLRYNSSVATTHVGTRVDNALGQLAAQIASTYRLRGADAVYMAVAQRLQIPLVSWDQEHLERAAAGVATFRPGEAPGLAEKT